MKTLKLIAAALLGMSAPAALAQEPPWNASAIYERYRHPLQTRDDIPRTSWLSHNDIARFNEIWNPAP